MSDWKPIKIHEMVYEKLKSRQRFNESFSDCLNRILAENDMTIEQLGRLLYALQEMRTVDTERGMAG